MTIRGRETELDKKIIEQIAEPLVHMIRNALDHGLETPAERIESGKPGTGQLLIWAEQQGNRMLVAVRDDGRGIDPGTLREAAARRGLASALEMDLDTAPGARADLPARLQHADGDRISGRGVGMDIVETRGGEARRHRSHSVRAGSRDDGRPGSPAVARPPPCRAGRGRRRPVRAAHCGGAAHLCLGPRTPRHQPDPAVEVGDDGTPLIALSALLQIAPAATVESHQTVVVAEVGDSRFGLIVDAVQEEQELVFKELRGPLRNQRTFAGAALLGNGDIVPILDVQALFELVSRSPSGPPVAPIEPRPAAVRRCKVLLADDSLVAGELQKNILLAAGYETDLAHDGAEAFELLHQKEWDLLITDVDMPHLSGFELTALVRADDRLRDIPVIIVTGRDD